ncbi:hypothetical protein JD844_004764 [Phrynosoma platyrhinos]|uniref:Uncharacterized protein n=1 Tax=Phrynosoma platyrhinos TaxID=52577 RepID=A0ABQ7SDS1_PHRPL|nr:hypothetical protein JD844_004764 [Phrynosoma platyrhinos]
MDPQTIPYLIYLNEEEEEEEAWHLKNYIILQLFCGLLYSALAEFDEPKRSTFVMFGVLTIAVRIYHDRWGYGVYSGPIGTAVLMITVKWVRS